MPQRGQQSRHAPHRVKLTLDAVSSFLGHVLVLCNQAAVGRHSLVLLLQDPLQRALLLLQALKLRAQPARTTTVQLASRYLVWSPLA